MANSGLKNKDTNGKKSKKKKGKYADYKPAPANSVYFLFDVETSGSRRNWDCIIAISFLCYSSDGELLASFSRKINPGAVQIQAYLSKHIHSKLHGSHQSNPCMPSIHTSTCVYIYIFNMHTHDTCISYIHMAHAHTTCIP